MSNRFVEEPWLAPNVRCISDIAWENLKSEFDLPDCRASLDLEFYGTSEAIALARRAPTKREVENQLGCIRRAKPGQPMPTHLLDDVVGLLAGVALAHDTNTISLLLDPRDYENHTRWMERIRGARTVTPELRLWAKISIALGACRRAFCHRHGKSNLVEQQFICVLIYFWRERLGRRVANWVVDDDVHEGAALTKFVVHCLKLVGALVSLYNGRFRIRRALAKLNSH